MLIKVSRGTRALARFSIDRPDDTFFKQSDQFESATLKYRQFQTPRYLWVLTQSTECPFILTTAVASNRPTEALASVISFTFVVYSHYKHS